MTPEIAIALTIWFEARSEGHCGMDAVASVIVNRTVTATVPRPTALQYSNTCLLPGQFSCWRTTISGVIRPTQLARPPKGDITFEYCIVLARNMISGTFKPTTTATHYHEASIHPYWASSMFLVSRIGNHLFYVEAL